MNQSKVVPLEVLYRAIKDFPSSETQEGCICTSILRKTISHMKFASIYNICSFCPLQKYKDPINPFTVCSINDKSKLVHQTRKAISTQELLLTYEIKGDKEKLLQYLVKKFPNLILEET